MLRELLLRDLALHRRVLLTAAVSPIVIALSALAIPGNALPWEGALAASMMFGLVLVTGLPLTLHFRERSLGTLADLLVLPVARRELVRLRFLEACLAMLTLELVFVTFWAVLRPGEVRGLLGFMGSQAPLWILFIFMAYPLPFALRWGGWGVASAMGALFGSVFLVGQVLLRWGIPHWLGGLWELVSRVRATGPLTAGFMDFSLPLLLLAAAYRLSVRAMERIQA